MKWNLFDLCFYVVPPSLFSICFSVLSFLSRPFFLFLLYKCYGSLWLYSLPSFFSLHFLAVWSHLFWWYHLLLRYTYHPIIPNFLSSLPNCLLDSCHWIPKRHITHIVQNSTNHIPLQICAFLINSLPLLSIRWPSQKLENIISSFLSHMPPKSVNCSYHKLTFSSS